MPMEQFARILSDQTGVSIIYARALDNATVTLEVVDQPIGEVLALVARRHGTTLRVLGGLYYLGDAQPQDRGVLVRRVRRLSQEDLASVLTIYASETGRHHATADGLVVVGDTNEVLERVDEMLTLAQQETPVWAVQLHLVTITDTAATELGVESTHQATAEIKASAVDLAATASGSSLDLTIRSVLLAGQTHSGISVEASPLFLVMDGGKATWQSGDRVPVPRRSTSPEGTVTTEGFEYVDAGTRIEVSLRETSQNAARLAIDYEQSQIVGLVETAPRTTRESLIAETSLRSGETYLIATIDSDSNKGSGAKGLSLWRRNEAEHRITQVWARAYRIAGDGVSNTEDRTPTEGVLGLATATLGKAHEHAENHRDASPRASGMAGRRQPIEQVKANRSSRGALPPVESGI